jgi:D-glycerate 3-kinase
MNCKAYESLILDWCKNQMRESASSPLIIGLSGAQGIGKTCLTNQLCRSLDFEGYRTASFSIDDFYLPQKEMQNLAEANAANPFLQHRGYPGTHDLELAKICLDKIKRNTEAIELPIFDKSLFNGKGDQVPKEQWTKLKPPFDIVIFEGWMLGFTPVIETENLSLAMRDINQRLKNYENLWSFLDAFILLEAEKLAYIVDWRCEAEEKLRLSRKMGMSLEETRKFTENFIQAYELYYPELKKRRPCQNHEIHLMIGKDRLPVKD